MSQDNNGKNVHQAGATGDGLVVHTLRNDAETSRKTVHYLSIHALCDKPYNVPGTSPSVSFGFSAFRSKMTKGGIVYPAALEHARTVNWDLSPLVIKLGYFEPTLSTTFKHVGFSGRPVSSQSEPAC